jgi:uncharacterized protein (TIGR03435 family)
MRRTSLVKVTILIFVITFCIGATVVAFPQAADRFEVTSVKPTGPAPAGGRGGGPGAGAGPLGGACSGSPQVVPGRLIVTRATLLRLFTWAYGIRACRADDLGLFSGVQEWMTSDRFDVEGIMPAGSPVYVRLAFTNGEAPKLQLMLQNLLADRFKLVVRREMKDMPVYNLVVAKPGKMKASENQAPADPYGERNGITMGPGGAPPPGVMLASNGMLQGTSISISALAQSFQAQVDHPVIDKTGLKGLFDIRVQIELAAPTPGGPPPRPDTNAQVLEALGLKLESGRGQVEVFVIERAEKPTVN